MVLHEVLSQHAEVIDEIVLYICLESSLYFVMAWACSWEVLALPSSREEDLSSLCPRDRLVNWCSGVDFIYYIPIGAVYLFYALWDRPLSFSMRRIPTPSLSPVIFSLLSRWCLSKSYLFGSLLSPDLISGILLIIQGSHQVSCGDNPIS